MTLAIDDIRSIGIIGAGQMGSGIAQIASLAGYDVRMADINAQALDAAVANITKNLERQVARGKLGEDEKNTALKRIHTGTEFKTLGQCDVVIEAATEREELKREIFIKLVPELSANAIVASNTSSISITRLAAATDRPTRFIGMHFMNPVPAMQLVELIRGIATDDPTFQTIRALAIKLGKHRHRRSDLSDHPRARHQTRQDTGRGRGFSCLHRQSHPAADDQRGGLYPL